MQWVMRAEIIQNDGIRRRKGAEALIAFPEINCGTILSFFSANFMSQQRELWRSTF
jgi:hypothetical protein